MVCLDANVLIEIILDRPKASVCRQFMERTNDDMAVTTLSLDLVMYYAERHNLALQTTQQFLRTLLWLPLLGSDAEAAFGRYHDDDYEDALQISCALREKCAAFVTLDKKLAKKYQKSIGVVLL